jgi:hypothetical protein
MPRSCRLPFKRTRMHPQPTDTQSQRRGKNRTAAHRRSALWRRSLASAALVQAWIETATGEDLRAVAAEPKKFLRPHVSGFGQRVSRAYLEAIAARWLTLDPEGALPAIAASSELRQAAARIRPEAGFGKTSLETNNGNLDSVARTALQTLGAAMRKRRGDCSIAS